MSSIDDLAATIRRRCDEDERLANELAAWADGSGRDGVGTYEFNKLIGDLSVGPFGGQSRIRNWGTGQDIAKLADPHRVLLEVASKRALLDVALGWKHHENDADDYHSCSAVESRAERYLGGPCDCGRDERVLAVLQLLATPYEETT